MRLSTMSDTELDDSMVAGGSPIQESQDAVGGHPQSPEPIELNELQVLLHVETEDGKTLPNFLFHTEAIDSICLATCGISPVYVRLIGPYEALLGFERGVNVSLATMAICKCIRWYGVGVRIRGSISDKEVRRKMYGVGYEGPDEFHDIEEKVLPPKPQDQFDQLTEKLLEKLTAHVDEKLSKLSLTPKPAQPGTSTGSATGQMPSGNSNVLPSVTLHSRDGKAPKINIFTGSENPARSEVSYAQWIYEVRSLKSLYPEGLLREGIIKSLRGTAADLVRFLGPSATTAQILDKLETVYGAVANFDQLILGLYTIRQERGEKVQQFATRLEDAVNQIELQYPNGEQQLSIKRHLKDRLFHGMKKNLRDTIRFHFEQSNSTYESLLVNAKKSEAEEVSGNLLKANLKSADAEVEVESSELTGLKEQLANVMAAVKELGTNNNNGNQRSDQPKKKVRFEDVTKAKRPWSIPKGVPQCYRCGGWGHMRRECPTSADLNLKGGGEGSQPLPKEQKYKSQNPWQNPTRELPKGLMEIPIRPPTPVKEKEKDGP